MNDNLKRIALGIAYHGVGFNGWQTQADGNTVQDHLEQALATFANEPLATICAGRTDTGVHALNQIVHIDTRAVRRIESWVRGLNALLPDTIRVRWAHEASPEFHARFAATSRTYVYILRNERVLAPSWLGRAGWDFRPLDVASMQAAAHHLIGQHDFSAFRSSICQAASPIRTLEQFSIQQHGVFIIFTLKANAFLHHMVRNIVGALVYVGSGRMSVAEFAALLAEKSRLKAPPTFMPDGLYLTGVDYPPEWGVATPPPPEWLWF